MLVVRQNRVFKYGLVRQIFEGEYEKNAVVYCSILLKTAQLTCLTLVYLLIEDFV